MNKKDKRNEEPLGVLKDNLKEKLKDIIFLELNKEININNNCCIPKDVPLPMNSHELISGIKKDEYKDSISFEKFVDCMIYVIGADDEFKYTKRYIELLHNMGNEIDSYILGKAFKMVESKSYMDALVYFNALGKISNKHMVSEYNIANTLRLLALDSKGKEDETYELYYNLSYNEFKKLAEKYPDNFYVHYYLGFYNMDEEDYECALSEWQEAYSMANDEQSKDKISKLIMSAEDNMIFKKGKENILEGDILDGLKSLIPLTEKYSDWSEVKYYTALGYRKIGNFVKAELLLQELIDSGEDFSEIYNELGLCYFNLGGIEKSIESLEKAVYLKPYEPGYLCNLGIAYNSAGYNQKAREAIEKAYKIKPDDEITLKCKKAIDNK